MRRFLFASLMTITAVFSFLVGLYLFFPRDAALGYFWQKGVLAAAEKGITLESAALSMEGTLPFHVVLRNVRLAAPLASAEASVVRVVPLFLESVFSFAPTAEIHVETLTMTLPLPGQPPLVFSTFSSKGSVYPAGIKLSAIRSAGDLLISGELTVNPSTARLDEADLAISGERAALLEYAKTMLPLKKESSGGWTLKRKGGENK